MGPYQRTPKEVGRALRYSGLGVRSVGPVGNFLEYSINLSVWYQYHKYTSKIVDLMTSFGTFHRPLPPPQKKFSLPTKSKQTACTLEDASGIQMFSTWHFSALFFQQIRDMFLKKKWCTPQPFLCFPIFTSDKLIGELFPKAFFFCESKWEDAHHF